MTAPTPTLRTEKLAMALNDGRGSFHTYCALWSLTEKKENGGVVSYWIGEDFESGNGLMDVPRVIVQLEGDTETKKGLAIVTVGSLQSDGPRHRSLSLSWPSNLKIGWSGEGQAADPFP